jgi:pimeloyl-ACP methyl ester carboxylesterase
MQILKRAFPPALVIFLLAFLLLVSGCSPDPYGEPVPGTVCLYDFPSSVDGLSLRCSVYLPANYNPSRAYPVWVELHALYGKPILTNDPSSIFGAELKRIADERGWIIFAPWGRNLHSLFAEGAPRQGELYEPSFHDDFSTDGGLWRPLVGTWRIASGRYVQSDASATWKESVRLDSTGKEYSLRVKVRDLAPSGTESGFGVNLRRQDNGDAYHVDLFKDASGNRFVRLFRISAGNWERISVVNYPWEPFSDGWVHLKFSCYADYLEVYVNEEIVNMRPGYDSTPYGYGYEAPGAPLPAGKVSLCSYGGVHEFDDVLVQNEYPYGLQDVVDCLFGLMEKYRVDPTRIYVAGHSQGGTGSYIMGLRYPDLCAAVRAAAGITDMAREYSWLCDYYPDYPGIPPYAEINDGRLKAYMRSVMGGAPGSPNPAVANAYQVNSARYILENGRNTAWRIVHGTPDAHVPNTRDPVQISWWAPWWFTWGQYPAPDPYRYGVSDYAHGKDVADLLNAWAAGYGGYGCQYITSSTVGHGYLDAYSDTASFFQDKSLPPSPEEVAYKAYGGPPSGAWWLRLEVAEPGSGKPGLARVRVERQKNTAQVHARNVAALRLDLPWMGMSFQPGSRLSFFLDDDPSPVAVPVVDNLGKITLRLAGPWRNPEALAVSFDGSPLSYGSGFRLENGWLVIPNLPTPGGHRLEVTLPAEMPANLLSNPGFEAVSGGVPVGWSTEASGPVSASGQVDDLARHGGSLSARIRGALFQGAGGFWWRSAKVPVKASSSYELSGFMKARMFRGGEVKAGIYWYDSTGRLLGKAQSPSLVESGKFSNLEWVPFHFQATAPAGAAYASVYAGVESAGMLETYGSVWFDDLYFSAR